MRKRWRYLSARACAGTRSGGYYSRSQHAVCGGAGGGAGGGAAGGAGGGAGGKRHLYLPAHDGLDQLEHGVAQHTKLLRHAVAH